jgi:hypothetical protein
MEIKNKLFVSIVIMLIVCCWQKITFSQSMLIIETDGHPQYHYQTLQKLAENVGFKIHYKNLFSMLQDTTFELYDCIMFIPSISFIRSLKSPQALEILEKIQNLSQKASCFGLLLPSPHFTPSLQNVAISLLAIGNMSQKHKENLTQNFDDAFKKLLWGDSKQGMLYGTTLLGKNQSPLRTNDPCHQVSSHALHVLPQQAPNTTLTPQALPLALLTHDEERKKWYFIGRSSDFTYADLEENFFKNPFDITIRDQLLQYSQQILNELFAHISNTPSTPKITEIPSELTSTHNRQTKKYRDLKYLRNHYSWIKQQGVSCAWLSFDDFFGADYDQKTFSPMRQKSIKENSIKNCMEFIHDAGFNVLWIEFIPEWYLAPHGYRKHKKQEFIERVQHLAQELRTKFHNKPMPKIFIGTNLTSNFREQHPKHKLIDFWGKEYPNIPSPLDFEHFWRPELLEPLQTFVSLFSAHVPIDGVFLDFEMYHAQDQLAHYTDLHDFSDLAWNIYSTQTQDQRAQQLTQHADRLAYLQKYNLFGQYYAILEQEATNLGKMLKHQLNAIAPNIMIGAYGMTLPQSWFYRGLLRGMSSSQEPLLFASFNTDFYTHAKWLNDQNIHLLHGAVLMLSKLQEKKDFDTIKNLKKHHDFIWYNRASRMGYSMSPQEIATQYWALEASPLPAQQVAHEINKAEN